MTLDRSRNTGYKRKAMDVQNPASACPTTVGKPYSDHYRGASDKYFWMLAFASRLQIPDRIMACYIYKHLATEANPDETDVFLQLGNCSIMELVYAQHFGALPETQRLVEQACTKIAAAVEAGALTTDFGSFASQMETHLKAWLFAACE